MKHYQKWTDALISWGTMLALSVTLSAYAADAPQTKVSDNTSSSEIHLSIGKSQIIHTYAAVEQVVIGSPTIADVKALSSRQVLILGINPGRTNLVLRDSNQSIISVMDVIVGYDLTGIKRKLSELLPGENNIQVRDSNHSVILSGQVNSLESMAQAVNVARSYAPAEKVINMMEIAGGQQVMLEVHIAEVSRKSLKQLGVQLDYAKTSGSVTNAITGAANPNAFSIFDITDVNSAGTKTLKSTIDALEQKGLAKTLAEPNLVALTGQEASFLAGGEFPIPVTQTGSFSGAITVEYKTFGIGLKFTPTVLSNDKINIKLTTEVSAIDTSNTYSTSTGINLPTILTRKAGTTIEMADGQGFAIAGLMQSDMNNAINQVPGLGSIPILGALFRSTDYQRKETELVIVITPRLVDPANPENLDLPTDNIIPPTSLDQYLLGTLEHWPTARRSGEKARKRIVPTGLEGRYGHQLEEEKK